jgi:hypothetical protein
MSNLPDIQRNYMFELWIPNIAALNLDDMRVRIKTAEIPSRGNEFIASHYMGMQQFYVAKPTFTHQLAVNIEEHEDKKVAKALYSWQQLIFDVETNGASLATKKSDIVKNIDLKMYKFDGTDLSTIRYFNAFPENVGNVNLGFTESGAVTYPVTFRFDRWELVKPRP